jgi:hypothetical protein
MHPAKNGNKDEPCGVEQGSNECFAIACPTCKIYQEKENGDKYTDENILREVKNETDGLLSEIVPQNVGRPLCIIMIGDEGYYYRKSPAFDGDYDNLITCLNYLIEDFKERSQGRE